MLFHDHNIQAMKSCWKRAERFARKGEIHGQHLVWKSNVEAAMSAEYDLGLLSWVAERIDLWCQDNLIDGDESMAALLYWWKEQMFFDPTALPNDLEFQTPAKDKFEVVAEYYKNLGMDIYGTKEEHKDWWVKNHYDFVNKENEKNATQP